ncbi:hypothetical protein NUW58_g9013 [Xylaria curta]|uniref:Uncharacterized protein n=1 Tax=Xylaria curta TaxID=42375 RepID=A0ACC1N2L2_9PEZI|nr:hypothetical protein NUW58_g9013 [Xylaria curta]
MCQQDPSQRSLQRSSQCQLNPAAERPPRDTCDEKSIPISALLDLKALKSDSRLWPPPALCLALSISIERFARLDTGYPSRLDPCSFLVSRSQVEAVVLFRYFLSLPIPTPVFLTFFLFPVPPTDLIRLNPTSPFLPDPAGPPSYAPITRSTPAPASVPAPAPTPTPTPTALAPNTIDAILITGSKHNAFDNDEWIIRLVQFTKRCLEGGRIRVIGICYGHQIIGRALGAELGRNTRGWEVSVVEHELTEEGKRVLGLERMSINQMHRDAVLSFPPGVIQLAYTDVCANQAMYIPGRMVSVQGHPEFTEEMVREILDMRKYGGIVDDDIYQDGVSRVANRQDGVAVAQAFLRFLHG